MNGEFTRFQSNNSSSNSAPKIGQTPSVSQGLNVLLNYWEIKPAQYEARLHELALKGVVTISAFVPWAHLETDIYHSLKKFLRAAVVTKLKVKLFVMPELGVNYPNAGFPKDIIANVSNLAVDRMGRVIYNEAAPNIFPLPSFSSPEVLKRFANYLIRVGGVLAELTDEATPPDFCEVIVTNSLFNYYRSYGLKLAEHGDYSAAHVMAFRDFLDREYRPTTTDVSQAGTLADYEQFKMQLYEGYNRHRFFTHIEKMLREKTDMVFARKKSACPVRHVDMINPECEPDTANHSLLVEMFDLKPSVERFYEGIVAGGYRNESIYLGNTGIFRRFSDQERSFLILASLIHAGELSITCEELFKLSASFQNKLRNVIGIFEEKKFVRRNEVTYVSASKFAMEPASFDFLKNMCPGVLEVSPGVNAQLRKLSERLVFMDPRSIIRLFEFVQLLSYAQAGKVVAIPFPMSRVANFTKDAMAHFDKFKKGRKSLKLNLGVPYEVFEYHMGHVVFYDPQLFWATETPMSAPDQDPAVSGVSPAAPLASFFQSLLGLAEIKPTCLVSDARLRAIHYVSEDDNTQKLLFLINPTQTAVAANISFQTPMRLSTVSPGMVGDESAPIIGKGFELSVPPLGIFTLRLTEVGQSELARESERLREYERTAHLPEQGSSLWT